jgi:hypothetical protein
MHANPNTMYACNMDVVEPRHWIEALKHMHRTTQGAHALRTRELLQKSLTVEGFSGKGIHGVSPKFSLKTCKQWLSM